eukprot:4659172-Amphidinium_carterae.1
MAKGWGDLYLSLVGSGEHWDWLWEYRPEPRNVKHAVTSPYPWAIHGGCFAACFRASSNTTIEK